MFSFHVNRVPVNVKTHNFITPNLIHTGIHLCEQWQQNEGQPVPQQKVPANINNRPQIMVLEACFYTNLTCQIIALCRAIHTFSDSGIPLKDKKKRTESQL